MLNGSITLTLLYSEESIPVGGGVVPVLVNTVDDGLDGEVATAPTNDSKNWSELQCKRVNSIIIISESIENNTRPFAQVKTTPC